MVVISIIIFTYALVPTLLKTGMDNADKNLPNEMIIKMDSINTDLNSDSEFLKKTYDMINAKFSSKEKYYLRALPTKFFERDLQEIWEGTDDRPCNIQNYVLKTILINSGRFKKEDIEFADSLCRITPHQYLKVKVEGIWIDVDLWGADHGIKFGEHASWKNCGGKQK
tara:strand:+ start:52 stop:555 length:504 start_codon:yes stop_codon:yes gene_type:complete